MGQIDVSEVLLDPDFVDPMQLVTRVPTTDLHGEGHLTESTVNSYGSIQPANFKTVQKMPEAMRVDNLMSFWFRGTIVASAPGKYASVLVFKGIRYQVLTVADWSSWGAGWTEGVCIAEPTT